MTLTDLDRTLLRLSVAICNGDRERIVAMRREAGDGARCRAWREAVLQSHLFAGFPRVVAAMDALHAAGGLGEPDPEEAAGAPEDFEAGRALFERIYREKADPVRGVLRAYHPALAAWVEGHAYGRVLTRGGLSVDRRELLAVVCLAAGGQERQLASHVRGAVHCGASPDEVRSALDAVADLIDDDRLREAQRVVAQFAQG